MLSVVPEKLGQSTTTLLLVWFSRLLVRAYVDWLHKRFTLVNEHCTSYKLKHESTYAHIFSDVSHKQLATLLT